jgi:hypothetical protein
VVAGVESGPVYVRFLFGFLLAGAALAQVSVFYTSFSFHHCYTFSISYHLYAAAPSNTTDAHWETGEFERKKITFLALKSVYAFGNNKVCANPALRNDIHKS